MNERAQAFRLGWLLMNVGGEKVQGLFESPARAVLRATIKSLGIDLDVASLDAMLKLPPNEIQTALVSLRQLVGLQLAVVHGQTTVVCFGLGFDLGLAGTVHANVLNGVDEPVDHVKAALNQEAAIVGVDAKLLRPVLDALGDKAVTFEQISLSIQTLVGTVDVQLSQERHESRKARIFVGSSVEGKAAAEQLQLGLDYDAECTLWSQGVFGLSIGTLENLIKASKAFEFAVLVLTPDDLVYKRDAANNSPRDNVLFELGLFMGALGRERTYIVYCRDEKLDLPTDLAGVTAATFAKREDGNLQAAMGAVCTQIKMAIKTVRAAEPPQ